MALKALYICQANDKYGACGSLMGYLAGRSVTPKAATEAQNLIRQAATTTLVPPSPDSLSSLRAMADGQFAREVEDALPIPIPAIGLVAKAVSMVIGMNNRTACSEPGDLDMNTGNSSSCRADTTRINQSTYEFLNKSANEHLSGLKWDKVCRHYRARYEEQIRRSMYRGLTCPSSSGAGELASVVGEGRDAVERKLKYNEQGVPESISLSFANAPGGINVVEMDNGAAVRIANYQTIDERLGRRSLKMEISRLGSRHHSFGELAKLKMESAELISCCQQKQPALLKKCRDGFNGQSAPGRPPELQETGGGAVK